MAYVPIPQCPDWAVRRLRGTSKPAMTKIDVCRWLLHKLSEESAEVVQMASKVSIFGMADVYDKLPEGYDNEERLVRECNEVVAVLDLLQERGFIKPWRRPELQFAKRAKLLKYISVSRGMGILEG